MFYNTVSLKENIEEMMAKNEELKLDDSVKQNSKGEVILGQLYGPCADIINPTRNGRKYDESLWEKVFNNEIVNEYFECGGIPGELDHPTDRLETCSEKIAIMMPEKPKKDNEGHLIAKFDILDTPNGRIVYTLAKYGYKLGVSSRGNGETYNDVDGEHVNEDTYDFQAFDIVLLPAVKSARLKLAESLQNGKTFKQAINESLSKATPDEKKIMQETLNNLNIEYNHESVIDKKDMAVDNAEATIVKQLQESLLCNKKQETQLIELQEKLSVCYAKEARYEEDLNKYKSAIKNLSEIASNAKKLQKQVNLLDEQLKQKDNKILEIQNESSKILTKQEIGISRQAKLNEALSEKGKEISSLKRTINRLNESLKKAEEQNLKNENILKEKISDLKKDLTIKTTEYNNKLANSNKLVEQYRATAKKAVNKYIDSQALKLGLKSSEIMDKLPNNYSFADIDSICEKLSNFKLKINNLPLNIQPQKITIKESKEPILPKANVDDDIDDSLLQLAKTGRTN